MTRLAFPLRVFFPANRNYLPAASESVPGSKIPRHLFELHAELVDDQFAARHNECAYSARVLLVFKLTFTSPLRRCWLDVG